MFLGPLSTFAAVIPIVGSIARGAAGLAAFVVSLPLTLVVIAVAWIGFRPLIGVGLLVLAALLLYGLSRLHRSRHPAAPATAPA
jgi:Flp pilus assembly protein TadB